MMTTASPKIQNVWGQAFNNSGVSPSNFDLAPLCGARIAGVNVATVEYRWAKGAATYTSSSANVPMSDVVWWCGFGEYVHNGGGTGDPHLKVCVCLVPSSMQGASTSQRGRRPGHRSRLESSSGATRCSTDVLCPAAPPVSRFRSLCCKRGMCRVFVFGAPEGASSVLACATGGRVLVFLSLHVNEPTPQSAAHAPRLPSALLACVT